MKTGAPIVSCPICANDNVSMIPLAINESYRLTVSSKTALAISFYTAKILV